MRVVLHVFVVCLIGEVACVPPRVLSTRSGATYDVGMATRNFVDTSRRSWDGSRDRPIRTSIWYPVATGSRLTAILDSSLPFKVPLVAENAPVAVTGHRYPLILLSHGTGGSSIQMMWLGHYLASHGYVVAALNHHGNTGSEPHMAPQGFLLYWERPLDLSVVIDRLLADPTFGAAIDTSRVGAAGFSLGGYTVLAIAGARFNPTQYNAFCGSSQRDFTCGPQAEFPQAPALFEEIRKSDARVQESLKHASDSYRDTRVKAVLAIAPALGSGFTGNDLADIRIPVAIVVGEGDTVAPPATNAQRYAALISSANLTIVPGAVGHYTFLAECTDRGKTLIPICKEGPGVHRAKIHEQVSQLARRFFDAALTKEGVNGARTPKFR
jgi:predicted dienelactone hydrolase